MNIKCPTCGFSNIEGEDRCQQCFHSLMQRDVPRPKKDDVFQHAMMTTPISDLLTGEDLLVCKTSDTIQKVVDIFQKEKKGCVLVYQKKKLVGILSKRDLLWKIAGVQKDLSLVKVESIMTKNPEFVYANAPIAYVINKMSMGGFRHVPVLAEDGTPFSIISIQDVLSYFSERMKTKS